MKDLTVSKIERLNVLNNRFAIEKIQKTLDITGMMFDGEYRFTKKMVADFYEVEERTIERYLENFGSELSDNGYVLCKGKRLKDLKLQFAPVINVGSKTTQLGLFNFRSFLNIGMLLTESEKAKALRSAILDFGEIKINNKKMPLTHATFSSFQQSQDRKIRKESYNQFYKEYDKHKNTLAELYASQIKQDIFSAKIRNYKSVREMELFQDDIPVSVYDSLIESVHNALPSLQN